MLLFQAEKLLLIADRGDAMGAVRTGKSVQASGTPHY
jgi:hypothetical protein